MHHTIDKPVIISQRDNLEEGQALKTVYKLCKALDDLGINYCHWKSNAALDRSANGENDLDLLVSRSHASLFKDVIYRAGFKEALPPSSMHLPGIQHYYCYDMDADKFVHIHVHYQLVIGHDWTKNYHLPIERQFLETATHDRLFRISIPEFEFIVFVIRMVLKFSIVDAVLNRRLTLTTAAQQELEYLQTKINRSRVCDILQQHLRYIDLTLFDSCIESLQRGCSIWSRIKVKKRLQKKLLAHARRSQIIDTYLKLWRHTMNIIRRRIFGHSFRKRFTHGGAIIALVGGDGSGKSTAIKGLYTWLSKEFDTVKVHLGKPPRSMITSTVVILLKVGSVLKNIIKRHGTDKSNGFPGVNDNSDAFSGVNRDEKTQSLQNGVLTTYLVYVRLLLYICIARDRYRAYIKARRCASNGGLVICDRYPLPQIKLMDQPINTLKINTVKTNQLIKFLTRVAKKYQQEIMPPELLIVLRVAPEIAVNRKSDEGAEFVRVRTKEIWDMDWEQTCAHVIDAGQAKEKVLSDIKSIIWPRL